MPLKEVSQVNDANMPTLATVTEYQLVHLVETSQTLRQVMWCLGWKKGGQSEISDQDVRTLHSMLRMVGIKVPWCIVTPFCYDNCKRMREKRKKHLESVRKRALSSKKNKVFET